MHDCTFVVNFFEPHPYSTVVYKHQYTFKIRYHLMHMYCIPMVHTYACKCTAFGGSIVDAGDSPRTENNGLKQLKCKWHVKFYDL